MSPAQSLELLDVYWMLSSPYLFFWFVIISERLLLRLWQVSFSCVSIWISGDVCSILQQLSENIKRKYYSTVTFKCCITFMLLSHVSLHLFPQPHPNLKFQKKFQLKGNQPNINLSTLGNSFILLILLQY